MNETGQQQLSRRRFLGGLVVLGVALVPSGLATLLRSPAQDEASLAAARLTGLFTDPAEMLPLGRAHLDRRGDRPDERELLGELLPPDMYPASVVSSTDGELRDALRRWAIDDLSSGRVEEVGGWLLSRSEVRLAALVGLVSMRGRPV